MLHTMLIVVHTLAGLVGFILGCLVLRPSSIQHSTDTRIRAYQTALLIMAVSLVVVVAVDWRDLSDETRLTYAGLTVLGGYTVWRAWRAGVVRGGRPAGWRAIAIDDIGFTLITLFEGFMIVAAIDLGAPAWGVGVIAVAGVVLGRRAIGRVKRTELA